MQEAGRHRARRIGWSVAAGAAVLSGALWLDDPAIRYVGGSAIATAAAVWLASGLARGERRWPYAATIALVFFLMLAGDAQRHLWRVESDWERYRGEVLTRGSAMLRESLDQTAAALQQSAQRALAVPGDPAAAFRELAISPAGGGEDRGVVVYRGGAATAWGGTVRVPTDSLFAPGGAVATPFYLSLYAAASSDGARAVATALVHAEPPADRLVRALDEIVAERANVTAFDFTSRNALLSAPGAFIYAPGGEPLFGVRPQPLLQGGTRLRIVELARERGAAMLGIALALLVGGVWVRGSRLRARFAALGLALACAYIIPFNAFSNATRLFNPAIYFAPLGGPFTASAGALGITSAILLLGLLALLRAHVRAPPRWLAGASVVVIAALGPFLLRDLARGITPPAWGVTISLWLGWQVTLFLAALSLLLAGVTAGRAALGTREGVSMLLAPSLAGAAALLGPVLWNAPGRWPPWYPALWIAAIGALALARRDRRSIAAAAVVAGLGATTLVWGATVRERVALATEDIGRLDRVDEAAATLLDRFGEQLAADAAPETRAALLEAYVRSDLAAAGYPVQLTSWAPDGSLLAELRMAPFEGATDELTGPVEEALRTGAMVQRAVTGTLGPRLLLAVPDENFHVTAAAVEPRTRLIPGEPFALLLGIAPEPAGEPPYTLALAEVGAHALERERAAGWVRTGNELHSDWTVQTSEGPRRVHVEVSLRSMDALVQRGALILLVDLAVLALLWALSASGDGGFARWMRSRRGQWMHSYRGQLTLALFLFFVVPALLFAAWSYRRLQGDEVQSRELLVRETLRAIAAGGDMRQLESASNRLQIPLLLFEEGELARASDPLFELIAPTGRFVNPAVYLALGVGDEITLGRTEHLGAFETLFGYRAASDTSGSQVILSAPAPISELALDRRRRDLGVLVLFATAIGAAAALWLSGVAARQFARPIGALRRAALAIAAGEREPTLTVVPPSEFEPVFTAFRRMAADLDASRSALEQAQRRTAAILRNVASGVVAVDRDGLVTLANPRADALLAVALPPGTPVRAVGPEMERLLLDFLEQSMDEREFDVELNGRKMHGRMTRLTHGSAGAVLTLDDLTDLARAQRVLAWGEMARQVAHEIKNPLTPIRLGVQHLARARADARVDFDRVLDQNVTRILAEIDRLDEIARSFSRYGSAPAERTPPGPTDVAAVVRDVVALETMGGDVDEGDDAVSWTVFGAEGALGAAARPDELREVLLNLLENARLARARNVDIRLVREDATVRITVEDDGEGIPESVVARVFDPHFSTRTSGSGLGLAISRRIVNDWGGNISLSSESGSGTRVTVELPSAHLPGQPDSARRSP
ncbi:MAG: ATP-binding protein [Gemmatimonadaceae bacterium]